MKRSLTFSIVALAVVCLSGIASPAEAASRSVKIASFTATPSRIEAGTEITLKWRTKNADSCQLRLATDNDGKLLAANLATEGTYTVTPTRTERYQLYCTKTNGSTIASASKEKKVTVKAPKKGSALISTFSVSPSVVVFPDTVTVTLNARDVATCDLTAYNALTGTRIDGGGNIMDLTSNGTGTISTSFMMDPTMFMTANTMRHTKYEVVCTKLTGSKTETKSVLVTSIRR